MLGCGTPFPYQGHWRGSRNIPSPDEASRDIAYQLGKVDLVVKPNGMFDLVEGGLPKSGRTRVENGVLKLIVTHVVDQPLPPEREQVIEVRASDKDTVVFTDKAGIDPNPVTLKRIATRVDNRP
ncbi:MAG TPA: hypothetical protein PKA27_03705 [Fimbriimonadaceae bacterium]|nr:hypothetical protein [Fimbriimonadaceae bacterium]